MPVTDEGLLDLGGRLIVGVAGLVGVDDAGPGAEKVTAPARDGADADVDEPSIEKVTGLPEPPPVAVGV